MALHPRLLQIAVPVPVRKTFDYALPTFINPVNLTPGIRIQVPFGKRQLIGLLIAGSPATAQQENLKPIEKILDAAPLLPQALLELALWASHYYQYPVGEAVFHFLPALIRQGYPAQLEHRVWQLTTKGALIPLESLKRSPRQLELLKLLNAHPHGASEALLKSFAFPTRLLSALEIKGWIETHHQVTPNSDWQAKLKESPLVLNAEQAHAVTAILQRLHQFQPFLLEGITGSGKTEVYLQVAQQVLEQGKQLLILVPEIGLTPQMVSRFEKRFNSPIAVLHSNLTDKERLQAWLAAKSGQAGIIIGTRSAVLTPLAKPGIIIVDEEHDLSFKQQEGFRYSARDLAIRRAQQEHIPIVLGSATPALETWHNAKQRRYQHLHLSQRAGDAVKPQYEILDIRNQKLEEGLSSALLQAITVHLKQQQQVLLFINRRGYAPILMCHNCAWVASCARCTTRFTLHLTAAELRCHHCGVIKSMPQHCPECQAQPLYPLGLGTERIELALQKHFPQIPIVRIDRDSTRRKQALEEMLQFIQRGTACILLGTQMLAKGHHFPQVTLVAVIDADTGLFSSDFRGTERLAQLLVQVAGRAGRAEQPGRVMIQTHQPQHPLLTHLFALGYSSVIESILQERQLANLPPFSYFALLRAEAPNLNTAMEFLTKISTLMPPPESLQLLGPIPAPMAKRAGRFRTQLLIQAKSRLKLQDYLTELMRRLQTLPSTRKVRWSIDVDPLEMY